ncbi:MAG: diguanylate cyclase, partial [Coriobacteriia bacterium]|nr:diguanylate cyclase [Coriobacteriia bacterium]
MGDAPLITTAKDHCRECWGCVRHCPARAIRVVDGNSEIIAEKCVGCGLCVSECSSHGHSVRDDTDLVRALLASDRPVVAVLATEFVAALYPMSAAEVETRLEALGFYAVEPTLLGEELVAVAYETRHTRNTGVPVIRSTCPVVTDWVRTFRPALSGALVPVVPPYVAQARLVKLVYPSDCAVVYVSPCYARKDEWRDPQFEGAVDAVIDFTELARMLDGCATCDAAVALNAGTKRPEPLKELSLTDGYPRATLVSRDMTSSDVQVVRGLRALDRLLAAIEAGEAAPLIIDALNCEGCIDGPAVNPGMSLFAKRNVDALERESRMRPVVGSRELLHHLPAVDLVRAFRPSPLRVPAATDAQIDAILLEGEFARRADALDCGACGYATCVEHAEAIHEGNSSWDMCFPLQRRRLERSAEELAESATLDSLTSLWNRRVFSERLSEEVARHVRYGTPVSLLMLDLDGFKEINDRQGHVAGDAVLATVAEILRSSLRTTDLPARYGGDEFAVILPGVKKTDAFAVAEKLRAAIADARVDLARNGDSALVRASIGVAAAAKSTSDPLELVEA